MSERCAVTELEVSGCAHCRDGTEPPPERRHLGPWFTAAYVGRCSDCDVWTSAGEKIRADGEGGYLCERCGNG